MDEGTDQENEGKALLDQTWFLVVQELTEITLFNDNAERRIEAADALLRYFISLGQSINEPYIPAKAPEDEDE
jgi:hypothetical protein